jgi:hypothetical protein
MTPDVAAYVARVVAEAPPLTPDQVARIATLLRPVGRAVSPQKKGSY